jgi:hypothetical protein
MSKKYVQIRFQSLKFQKALGQILHNLRVIKPSYLKKDLYHNQYANVVYINNQKFEILDREMELRTNNLLKQQLKNEMENIKKESKSFREKKSATTIDSIITLSNSINQELKNGKIKKEKLDNLFLESANKIAKELDLEILNMSIHYDETTPHAHISFKNYKNGKAISNKLKKEYARSQDIVGKVFQKIGYERGEKKEKTNAKHLNIKQMHEMEKQELTKKEIAKNIKTEVEKIYKNNDNFLNFNKDNFRKDIQKLIVKYSNINFELKENKELKEDLEFEKTKLKARDFQNKLLKEEKQELKKILIEYIEKEEQEELKKQLKKQQKEEKEDITINKIDLENSQNYGVFEDLKNLEDLDKEIEIYENEQKKTKTKTKKRYMKMN